jgi:hypothetical protein
MNWLDIQRTIEPVRHGFQAIARGPLRLVILTDGESENVNELAGYSAPH